MTDEPKIEHKRWRLQMKIVERVPLCHSTKGFSDPDDDHDFWMLDCDLDYGHKGVHKHQSGTEWGRDERDPEPIQ